MKRLGESHFEGVMRDTFDSHLQCSGKVLVQEGAVLSLLDLSSGMVAKQEISNDWKFATDLQGGPVGFQCLELSRLRAFSPVDSIQVELKEWAVLDELDKTVVRLRSSLLSCGSEKTTWISVEPLRGYEADAEMVFHGLEQSGFAAGDGDFFPMVGIRKTPYVSKPEVLISPTQPIVECANKITHTFIEVARKNEAGILSDTDTEFIHDYRVSLRRVRSLLSLFRGVYPEHDCSTLKAELADVMRQTNRLRDLDVYLLDRGPLCKLVPERMHAGLGVMFAIFAEERGRALESVRTLFQSSEYNGGMVRLSKTFQSLERSGMGPAAMEPTKAFANRMILKRYKKIWKIAESIDSDTPDEQVHELRIQCKKLRYLMEFFVPLYPNKTIKPLIKALKVLQDVLGRFNDYSVQRESLSLFADTHLIRGKKGLQLAESVGALVATLYQLQLKARGEVDGCISGFVNKSMRSRIKTLCEKGMVDENYRVLQQ